MAQPQLRPQPQISSGPTSSNLIAPPPEPIERDDQEACYTLKCTFDDSRPLSSSYPSLPFYAPGSPGLCYDPRLNPNQLMSFLPVQGPVGNFHTGIRRPFGSLSTHLCALSGCGRA